MKFFLNRRYQLDTLDVYLSVIFISACTVVKRPLLSIFFNNWAVLKDYIFAFVRRVYFILAIFYFLFCLYILTAIRSTYRTFIFGSSKKWRKKQNHTKQFLASNKKYIYADEKRYF